MLDLAEECVAVSLLFERPDVLSGPNLLINGKLFFSIPLVGVFNDSFQVKPHLLDELTSFRRYRHDVQGDTLENVEES